MKKILLATFGILGVIGITAGVLITHKPVPKQNIVPEGEIQGFKTQDEPNQAGGSTDTTSMPGDFPNMDQITPTETAPIQPETELNEKKSLEKTASEFDLMMPSPKDLNGIE